MDNADPLEKPGQLTLPSEPGEPAVIEKDEYKAHFGEELANTLDLGTWHRGEDLANLYSRLEEEIAEAVKQEDSVRERVRTEVFPRLTERKSAPLGSGVYVASVEEIERVHRGLLFNGQVEACDGTSIPFDTLPLTILQIGVCLVSYRGDQGSWVHRLYRRDLRVSGLDPVEETLRVLEERQKRSGYDDSSKRDKLSDLARRGIMTFAERSVLMNKSQAMWRMGHGNPAPYELLTGSGMKELLEKSLDLLEQLVAHKKFLFVPSSPVDRMALTIGNALKPMEFAVLDNLQENVNRLLEGHYRGEWAGLVERVKSFAHDLAPRIIKGVFRASKLAPAQMFYAHEEHAHQAALIALADSVLQEDRGFPMLIDLADTLCRATFGRETVIGSTQTAYSEAGEPFRYLTERQSRR